MSEQDTRERLEADIANCCYPHSIVLKTNYDEVCSWLNRQAAITVNEMNHNNPYVGLVRGKQWERTEISDYYCGRCGWKVTDHDSYCPECGGALHIATNKPNSQFDVLKTMENAESVTSKNEIHNFDDSREQLEADIRAWHRDTAFATKPSVQTLLGWLDRQAKISERELCGRCSPYATAKDYMDTIERLTAERDQHSLGWAKANMGWAEANAEAEQWRQKCDQLKADLKTANDTINTLRASVAGLKETVEKLGAQ